MERLLSNGITDRRCFVSSSSSSGFAERPRTTTRTCTRTIAPGSSREHCLARLVNRGSAFTLIELIVVILILSLAAAVAYPKLSGGFLAGERLRSSVSALAAVASYARDQAVATRRVQVLSLDLVSGAYSVASASSPTPAPQWPPNPSTRESPAAPEWPPNPSGREGAAAPEPGEVAAPAAGSGVRGTLPEGVAFESVRLAGKTIPPDRVANLRFTPEGWADPAVIQVRGPGGEIHSVVITAPAGRIETYPSAVAKDESTVAN